MSYKKRETLLTWLDALGKWSLVDTYVLVLMMVAFKFHLAAKEHIYPLELDVYVNPYFGFYSFMVCTITSLLFTHVIIHYHRKVEGK